MASVPNWFTSSEKIYQPVRGPDESADPLVLDLECCTWSAVLHPVLGLECRYLECHVLKCLYYGCWVQGVLYLECRVTLSAASDRRQQGTSRPFIKKRVFSWVKCSCRLNRLSWEDGPDDFFSRTTYD